MKEHKLRILNHNREGEQFDGYLADVCPENSEDGARGGGTE